MMTKQMQPDPGMDQHAPRRGSVASLVGHGLLAPAQAARIDAALQALQTVGVAGSEAWSITRLKRNPGAFMAEVLGERPQVMADSKRKDAEPIVALSADDLMSLVEAATRAAGPGFATGREMHARLARRGPPLEITMRGMPRRNQPRLSMDDALAARPMVSGGGAEN
ncbi:hypothetical protein GE300_14890 [Rhodobacteraceae bacterium 2CG4]|uniref:Uncharacterized protein n=1 Tax=Halovulum marinum TaxID=2662447 RepID=A0A6L5Z2U5_9RHOB|nr:hypothetical protein [Halovulum marinum]MSU90886.1 hypothetical protein [Halovulum marinum]